MDILEIHTWNATTLHLERPDRVVIDLDPGPGVAWSAVADAARRVRAALRDAGLESFVKTTGGVGLHVVAPLLPRASWATCLDFTRAACARLAAADPRALTTQLSKSRRHGRILLDYLRNNRGNTAVAAFSTRARPGAPVSVPLAWRELDGSEPPLFTVRTLPARLARLRRDPWAGYDDLRQSIDRRALRTVGL